MHPLENLLLLALALALIALNAFFVASEFAIVKLRRTRVQELRQQHGWRGRVLAAVHSNLDAYLSACQLGITLASLGLGWVGEPVFAMLLEAPLQALGLGDDPELLHVVAFAFGFVVISYLHIVVGELAPKSVALRKPEAVSLWTAAPLYLFYWLMYPFIRLLNASANLALRAFGLGTGSDHPQESPYTLDELRLILSPSHGAGDEAPGAVEVNRMLAHTLELPLLHASDIMRSRLDLACIRSDEDYAGVRRIMQLQRYSRYPYIDHDSGDISGLLLHKDVVFEGPGADYADRLRRHLRPIERFHTETPISDLLRRFRRGVPHLALIEDVQGRVVGFVTLEDVLEAVFGEIVDEHEIERVHHVKREPLRLDAHNLLVRGDTPLFLLERELSVRIPEAATVSTVAGLFMERLGRMPLLGETIEIAEHRAEVIRARGSVLEAVRVQIDPPADESAG